MKHLIIYEDFLNEFLNIKKENRDVKEIINVKSLDDLYRILDEYNISLKEWNTGPYKSVEHLWKELKEDECILYNVDGKLHREVNFVGAKIIYIDINTNIKYKLFEEKAIFKDGRTRIRDIWYSMAEKFKFDENPKTALIRGMKEELNIDISNSQFTQYNNTYFQSDGDYPELFSFHNGYGFLITLNEEQYNPDGYIEHQSDKDIYFKWVEIKYNMKK